MTGITIQTAYILLKNLFGKEERNPMKHFRFSYLQNICIMCLPNVGIHLDYTIDGKPSRVVLI